MAGRYAIRERLAERNQEGELFVLVGIVAAGIGLFLVPIISVVSIYCGYKLAVDYDHPLVGIPIAGLGVLGVLNLFVRLTGAPV